MNTCELLSINGEKCSNKSMYIKNINTGEIVNCKSYCLTHINKIIQDFTKEYDYVKIIPKFYKTEKKEDFTKKLNTTEEKVEKDNKEQEYKINKTTITINNKLLIEYKTGYDDYTKLINLIKTSPLNINITLSLNKNILENDYNICEFSKLIYDNNQKKHILGTFNRWISSKGWISNENLLYIEYTVDYIDNINNLDENETTNKNIIINLQTTTNKPISINYPLDLLIKFKNICGMCNGLSNEKFNIKEINLKDFKLSSFVTLMESLETYKLPILTSNLDIKNLYELCSYMNVYPQLIDYTNLDADYIFLKNLPEYDKIIVLEERKLRKMLYSNENIDMKDIDTQYEINSVINYIKTLKIPKRKFINRDFDKIHNNLYGIPGNGFNRKFKKPKVVNKLKNLNFNNFCLAGGFYVSSTSYLNKYYGDLDFFITTKDTNKAIDAIKHIYNTLCINENELVNISRNSKIYNIINCYKMYLKSYYNRQGINIEKNNTYEESDNRNDENYYSNSHIKIPKNLTRILVTDKSISFFSKLGYQVQIILRLYNSITQVISGFDIDSCCIAYDGKTFYAMPRFVRSLRTNYNLIDPERQSENYCQRLYKYNLRGFDVAFPIELNRIDMEFLKNKHMNYKNYNGLSKVLKYFINKHLPQIYSNPFNNATFPMGSQTIKIDYGYINRYDIITIYDYIFKKIYNHSMTNKIKLYKYYNLYIENNPLIGFDKDANKNALISNDISNYINKYNIQFPFLILNNINDVIIKLTTNDNLNINDNISLFNVINMHTELNNKIEFKIKNPGTQLTNSFHPTNEDWYYDLYVRKNPPPIIESNNEESNNEVSDNEDYEDNDEYQDNENNEVSDNENNEVSDNENNEVSDNENNEVSDNENNEVSDNEVSDNEDN